MFWGLIMEPQRRYTQKVKKAFHISMAALDISTSGDESAQVMCGFEGRNYLLCTLRKPELVQCQLDLNFEVGSEVSFAANGKCHVHLTGYLTEEYLADSEVEEEEENEETEEIIYKKRSKQGVENGPPKKKPKTTSSKLISSTQDQNESEDSDDSDFLLDELEGGSQDNTMGDEEEDSDEEDEDVEEEYEEGEEEEEESSLSEDEVVVQPSKKSKVNGVENKQKKQTKQQNVDKTKEVKTPKKEKPTPVKKRVLQGGVIVEEIKEGQGNPAKNGKFVSVYYEGRLRQNNKLFDSTNKGSGFSFRLGSGEVIKAWDIGVVGMKQGGKRRIICPPAMAYGQKGSPPAIPPNSTLIFEVELRKVN